MVTKTRVLIILAVVVNLGFLFASRPHWFSGLNEHLERSRQSIFSDPVDLGTVATTTWRVPTDVLPVHDYAVLSLVIERTPEMAGGDYWEQTFELQVEVEAEGEAENAVRADRFVRSYFSPTNQPLRERPRLWAGWPDEHAEYWLGQIAVLPKESLTIRLRVLEPDPVLASARARMKLVPRYDSAVPGHIALLWLVRDAALLLAALAALSLGFVAFRR